jgi:hypothetical protein
LLLEVGFKLNDILLSALASEKGGYRKPNEAFKALGNGMRVDGE